MAAPAHTGRSPMSTAVQFDVIMIDRSVRVDGGTATRKTRRSTRRPTTQLDSTGMPCLEQLNGIIIAYIYIHTHTLTHSFFVITAAYCVIAILSVSLMSVT